ncbi:hypothetical protein [Flectobacillus roseus]|uniref:Uncharacterized protein n=1 Tax=Flectobacillus roseus TaxID=502259 RepID=A0ABT6Y5Z4_9BACT|nr:hypothetical protein [Flectobacillus roseus]MDI9858985.1 hypothetical protein [Flectobacillus roseus]
MQNNIYLSRIFPCLMILLISRVVYSQSSSFGNTNIGSSGELAVINSQHNFLVGGGALPGVISTQRTSPRGYFSFVGTSTYTGASNTAFVNGYVKSYMTAAFTFPIGSGTKLRTASISTSSTSAPTDAAYYGVNPTTDSYPTTSVASGVTGVSTKEYWDINGTTPAQITLTWDSSSGVQVPVNVKIVGWNGSQWTNIPATIVGGATTSSGSITTSSAIAPNTYSVYTLAGLDGSLSFGGTGTGASTGNPQVSAFTNEPKTGNASVELAPTGGTAPYVYSNGSSDAGCIAPSGAQPLPASSNFTVQANGSYTYTAPSIAGKYYYCIKVCDSSTPTAVCRVAVYTLDVTVPVGVGTLDCNKTRLLPAPIAGTPSTHLLVVTLNVTTAGAFPVSVSGSGMTTSTTSVSTTGTGVQTISIPVNYDGTVLGILTFNVGTSTCTADLSSATAKKKALVDVWTLDNCSIKIAAPALK